MSLLCLFVACTAFINQCNAILELSVEAQLSNSILLNYDKLNYLRSNRPVLNSSDTVNVSFGVSFVDMVGYNPDTKVAQFSLFERMTWRDPFLAWDPSDFDGLTRLFVPISALWKPDIRLWNSVSAQREVMDDGLLALVTNEGDVWYIPPTIRNVRCLEDPVLQDMIHCDLKYGSWAYDSSRLSLYAFGDVWNFSFEEMRVNGDWTLHQSSSSRNMVFYDCCPEAYTDITFHAEMTKRNKKEKDEDYWQYVQQQYDGESAEDK